MNQNLYTACLPVGGPVIFEINQRILQILNSPIPLFVTDQQSQPSYKTAKMVAFPLLAAM